LLQRADARSRPKPRARTGFRQTCHCQDPLLSLSLGGLWSNGEILWVADNWDDRIPAYILPGPAIESTRPGAIRFLPGVAGEPHQITSAAKTGATYERQVSSDWVVWETLTTVKAASNAVTLEDMETGEAQRFYRVVSP